MKLSSFINENNKHLATADALDLLGKMMQYDHDLRPTAEECMSHPYFNEVREESDWSIGKGDFKWTRVIDSFYILN